jgi:hypothetical protein
MLPEPDEIEFQRHLGPWAAASAISSRGLRPGVDYWPDLAGYAYHLLACAGYQRLWVGSALADLSNDVMVGSAFAGNAIAAASSYFRLSCLAGRDRIMHLDVKKLRR